MHKIPFSASMRLTMKLEFISPYAVFPSTSLRHFLNFMLCLFLMQELLSRWPFFCNIHTTFIYTYKPYPLPPSFPVSLLSFLTCHISSPHGQISLCHLALPQTLSSLFCPLFWTLSVLSPPFSSLDGCLTLCADSTTHGQLKERNVENSSSHRTSLPNKSLLSSFSASLSAAIQNSISLFQPNKVSFIFSTLLLDPRPLSSLLPSNFVNYFVKTKIDDTHSSFPHQLPRDNTSHIHFFISHLNFLSTPLSQLPVFPTPNLKQLS